MATQWHRKGNSFFQYTIGFRQMIVNGRFANPHQSTDFQIAFTFNFKKDIYLLALRG